MNIVFKSRRDKMIVEIRNNIMYANPYASAGLQGVLQFI